MKNARLDLIALLAASTALGCADAPRCDACDIVWSHDLGATGESDVTALAADAAGNVVVMGTLYGDSAALDLHATDGYRVYLAELDPAGTRRWATLLPPGIATASFALAPNGHFQIAGTASAGLDLGGGVLGGGAPVLFVAELDARGRHVASRAAAVLPVDPNAEDYRHASPIGVAVDREGSVLVAGCFTGSLDFGEGDLDFPENPIASRVFAVKYDAAGHLVYSRRFGTQRHGNETVFDTYMAVSSLAVDPEGALVIAGDFTGDVEVGCVTYHARGGSDAFVGKLDARGDLVFMAPYDGAASSDEGRGVTTDEDGTIYWAGSSTLEDSTDGLRLVPVLGSLSPRGEPGWVAQMAEPEPQNGYAGRLAVGADGDVVALLTSSRDGATSSLTVQTFAAASGAARRGETYLLAPLPGTSAPAQLAAEGLGIDPLGHAVIGGSYLGAIDFGTGKLTSPGDTWLPAGFVAKLTP
jgi:hypothetical protein